MRRSRIIVMNEGVPSSSHCNTGAWQHRWLAACAPAVQAVGCCCCLVLLTCTCFCAGADPVCIGLASVLQLLCASAVAACCVVCRRQWLHWQEVHAGHMCTPARETESASGG
jgi:hypothetical protein